MFWLLHHGCCCQCGICHSGGLPEQLWWSVRPPCAAVLFLYLLQAHYAVFRSVQTSLNVAVFVLITESLMGEIGLSCHHYLEFPHLKTYCIVCPAAFPSLAAPLVGIIPNKRRDDMNHFFIRTIQKIIKQREEQPPEQVNHSFETREEGENVYKWIINMHKIFNIILKVFSCFFLQIEASRLPSADAGCTN